MLRTSFLLSTPKYCLSRQCVRTLQTSLSFEKFSYEALVHVKPQGHLIPHPEKTTAEDAYFISKDGTTFGVADGVGGWSDVGFDSSLYSNSILKYCSSFLSKYKNTSLSKAVAYAYSENVKNNVPGSSTLCLVRLHGRNLSALNLGDSGFMIVRNGNIICKTKDQVHAFNYPYQLGINGDSPERAQVWESELQPGDMVIMGTDGLFDNLYPQEILEIIARSNSDKIASNLAVSAYMASCSRSKDTPFSDRVAEETEEIWQGGKMDDITVIATSVS